MNKFISTIFLTVCMSLLVTSGTKASAFLNGTFLTLGLNHSTLHNTAPNNNYLASIIRKTDEKCLAYALYHEARGEPVIGQYAVAATILNRVRSRAYPSTICGVVYQGKHRKHRCQFSFACDGISDTPRNKVSFEKMSKLGNAVLTYGISRKAKFIGNGFNADFGNMTHYHRKDVFPSWSKKLKKLSQVGAHVFFKSNRVTKRYSF